VETTEENKMGLEPTFPRKMTDSLSFRHLVPALFKALSQGNYREKSIFDEVQYLMENYDAKSGEWQRFALSDDDPTKYSRNLIARNKHFTLLLLCWPPQTCSPIHDHGGSECWLRVVQGTLDERVYEKPKEDGPLHQTAVNQQPSPAVCFMNDRIGLHSIGNSSTTESAISLHCYVPGYDKCQAYLDEKSSAKKKQCFMSFTSIDGKKVVH